MNTEPDFLAVLAARVRAAAAAGTSLRIHGGGSKDFYGQSLSGEMLDMAPFSGIISYEPSELVVTARAGTRLTELEALLAEHQQCLAFEPPHFGPHATVGGMVASGLNGPARASVGAVRDFLLGVVLLNGRGEQLSFGGQVMKNVAGYDVSRLMAGALGTLGVLLEVSLKVLPLAPAEATLRCHLPQQQALDLLNRWGGQPLPLNASCWVHESSAPPLRQDVLFVRLRGAVAAVAAACPRLMADVQAAGGEAELMDNTQASADWSACREQTLPFFTQPQAPDACLWRLSVPQTTPALQLPFPELIEWHGGLRWLWAPATAAVQLRQVAQTAGGHATLFRRSATTPATLPVFAPLPPVHQRLQRELKKQFDPAGVFNPGRMLAEG
ncbi:glycolate oxidase subunit GlcE [Polaromonas sp.]|nr:glycolate oxidase subunit GlcE [Polaromonas sp.]